MDELLFVDVVSPPGNEFPPILTPQDKPVSVLSPADEYPPILTPQNKVGVKYICVTVSDLIALVTNIVKIVLIAKYSVFLVHCGCIVL